MARTKQRRTDLPYTFPAVAGTHLPTPRGGCKVQLAHGCYALSDGRDSQRDSNPRPRGQLIEHANHSLDYRVGHENEMNE